MTALRQQTLDLQETVEKLRRENAQLNVNTFEGKSALQQLQDLKNQHVHLENVRYFFLSEAMKTIFFSIFQALLFVFVVFFVCF